MADTSLDDVAKVDLLHDSRVDVLGFQGMLEGDGSKLGGGQGLEGTVDRANGGTGGGDDDNFVRLSKRPVSTRKVGEEATQRTMARERKGVERRDEEARRDKSMAL